MNVSKLSSTLLADLQTFLVAYLQTETERREILEDALGDDSPDLREISFLGSSEGFVQSLILSLADKEAYPGRNALVAVLSQLRLQADSDKYIELKSLQDKLSQELENYQLFSEANLVFISHASQDNELATRIAKDLSKLGIKVWIDDERLQGGHHWRSEIFRGLRNAESVVVLLTPASVVRPWVQREVSSAILLKKKIFPLHLEESFALIQSDETMRQLQDLQFIDFRQYHDPDSYEQSIRVLHAALMRRDKNQSPFRGLQSFEATDAEIFFGRENEAAEIRRQIQENKAYRLSVITGLSGTGKSSIMKAGVMAAMIPSSPIYEPSFQGWKYSLLRFANKPFLALAQALSEELVSVSAETIEADLISNPQSFFKYSKEILKHAPTNAPYVLFIDQFEELFRHEALINPILDLIFEAISKPEHRIYIVLTIRSDFFLRLSEHLGINQILNEAGHLRIISHMSRENILRTIVEPAQVVDLVYETGLANQILDDATAQAGSLPLLQYSLQQLYEERQDRMLTKLAYSKLGGIHQALARHAESVYESLSPSQQRLMRRLMLDLISVNEEQIATRIRKQLDELEFADWSQDELRYLVDYLLSEKARLLSMSRPISNSEDLLGKQNLSIELAHEALLNEWSQLKNWIAENRLLLVQRDRYERLSREWRAKNRSAADLLREVNLLEASRWLANPDASAYLSTTIVEFIQTSINYDARLWHESGRDVDLLIGSQLEFLQSILAELPKDSPYIEQSTEEFIQESTLAEANPYHRNAILWTRDEDVAALNIPLEPAQTWIENPNNSRLIADIHRSFFKDAFSLRASEWDKNHRSAEFLLKRHEIDRMQHLLSSAKQDWYLSDLLRDYIAKSENEYQRRQRLQLLVSVVVTVLALAATLLAYIANQRAEAELRARQDAETQRNLALSRQFAVQSQLALQDADLQAAFLLGIEAYNTAETADALSSLLTALQLSPQLEQYLFSIDSGVRVMAFQPDGEAILLGTENGDILRYQLDSQSLELLHEDTHDGSVWNLIYLEDGNRFLSVGTDGWLRLWNLSTGEMEQELLRDEFGGSYALAKHPTQDLIAVGGDDGNLYLWNAENSEIETMIHHQNTIYSLEFNSDGSLLAAASADNTISLWYTSDLTSPYQILEGHSNWVLDIAFHPTANILASAGADNLIKIWDLETGLELSSLDDHNNWVRQVAVTSDGQSLISASQDRQIFLWDIENPQNPLRRTAPLIAHQDTIYSLLLAENNRFFSTGDDGQVIQWQTESQLALGQSVLDVEGIAYDSIFNSDANLLISAVNNRLFFTDLETLAATREAVSTEGLVTALNYLPNSTSFVFALDSGTVEIWDIVLGRSTETFQEHRQAVYELAVSPDGNFLASASEDKTVVLRNLSNNTSQVLIGHTDRVNALAFSPNGQWLASAGHDQDIRIWNTATGMESRVIPQAHSRPIEALAFSSDGNELLSAARDNNIALWNIETGEQTALLIGHAGAVNSLTVYGNFLASGGSDGNVILWNIPDRYLIGRYSLANADDVLSLQFSSDGRQIAASYADGTVILWDSDVASWQETACRQLGQAIDIQFSSIASELRACD